MVNAMTDADGSSLVTWPPPALVDGHRAQMCATGMAAIQNDVQGSSDWYS